VRSTCQASQTGLVQSSNDLKAALEAERLSVSELKLQLATATDEAKRQREARHLAVAGETEFGLRWLAWH
jgi:hypothetical protein